ncbi:hypothetical protein MPER_02200 [Moniliophthora perniciosa FA553]|nr:hypothetical protein MPER_02200 [Moniliophthora perniciosa FA553]
MKYERSWKADVGMYTRRLGAWSGSAERRGDVFVGDQQRERNRTMLKQVVEEKVERLNRLKKELKAALLASKRVIDSRAYQIEKNYYSRPRASTKQWKERAKAGKTPSWRPITMIGISRGGNGSLAEYA